MTGCDLVVHGTRRGWTPPLSQRSAGTEHLAAVVSALLSSNHVESVGGEHDQPT